MAYEIDYNDDRFTQVESDKQTALSDLESTYADMINDSDAYYQAQIDAAQEWADKQSQLQQEQTDLAIEEIEWQKELTQKDYLKEQSAAYVDWMKQSNKYGANAEEMASAGLAGSGFSESSQVSMYNTYQNRVATARESYNQAVVNYNLAIKEARLQNNAALAEIAYQALQTQLELSLEGFQYKNDLILSLTETKLAVEESYYNRYLDVLQQINTENALAEEVRQFNASLAEDQRQFNESLAANQSQYSALLSEYESLLAQLNGNNNTPVTDPIAESGKYVTLPGYGSVTNAQLYSLIQAGYVKVTGTDKNGDPIYKVLGSNTKNLYTDVPVVRA